MFLVVAVFVLCCMLSACLFLCLPLLFVVLVFMRVRCCCLVAFAAVLLLYCVCDVVSVCVLAARVFVSCFMCGVCLCCWFFCVCICGCFDDVLCCVVVFGVV